MFRARGRRRAEDDYSKIEHKREIDRALKEYYIKHPPTPTLTQAEQVWERLHGAWTLPDGTALYQLLSEASVKSEIFAQGAVIRHTFSDRSQIIETARTWYVENKTPLQWGLFQRR